jgi:diaminopimelate epimerase
MGEARPEELAFTKMEGIGNDFVVVDARHQAPSGWSAMAEPVCNRRYGVGADGLLVIDYSDRADVRMRMFNPDGTEDFCGNGLRCVARYVLDRSHGGQHLLIDTIAGVRQATMETGDGLQLITVQMGEPRFQPEELPMRVDHWPVRDYPLMIEGETLPLTVISTGTTHSIAFVDELPPDERFFRLSPQIERHPVFPDRTSIMWTMVESPDRLRLRIWERGGGETFGCGTGACAAAVAAQMHGFVGEEVTVASKGGKLVIRYRTGEQILMTGPAEYSFEGVYSAPEHLNT